MTRAADGFIRQVDDLMYGAECVFRGLRIFYSRPRLWPYALPPLVCVFLLYGGVLALIHFQAAPALESWLTGVQFPSWLSWLQTALQTGLTAILWIASALILLICLGSIYEMFGGILFDYLLEAFEKKAFPERPGGGQTIRETVVLTCGMATFAVVSAIKMLFLLFLSFLIPVVGPLVFFLYSGAVYGVSYLSGSAIRQSAGIRVLKRQVARNRLAVLGFGCTANILLMIPFFILILMPGLVIGGSILYHGKLMDPAGPVERTRRELPA